MKVYFEIQKFVQKTYKIGKSVEMKVGSKTIVCNWY